MSRRSSILPLGNDPDDDESSNPVQDAAAEAAPTPAECRPGAPPQAANEAAAPTQGGGEQPAPTQTGSQDPTAGGAATPTQAATAASTAGSSSNVTKNKVGSGQGQDLGTAAPVDVIMATNRPIVSLNGYTGYPLGTQGQGGAREDFTAENWCRRVEMVAASAQWNDEQAASHAALALVPNSPAERWYTYASQNGGLDTWAKFKTGLIKEFSPPETVIDKVNMFKSLKMGKNERATDFANKLHLKFEKFEKDLDHLWTQPAFADEAGSAPLKDRRIEVVKEVMGYLKMIMFAAGLPDNLITEVTKAKSDTLTKMLEVCKLSESAQAATAQKPRTVAGMTTEEEQVPATKEEIMKMITAAMKGEAPKKAKGDKQGKQKDFSKATCYYCGKTGHISPACPGKKEDRQRGIYRVCAKDPPLTKEQWEALPKEQKTFKGKHGGQASQQGASASIQVAPPEPQAAPPPQFNWWGHYYQEN